MSWLEPSITAEQLNANNKLLLHKSLDETHPKEHTFICGAVLEQGHYFQCSPNVNWMDEAPAGGMREVFMRADHRYADDDYIQWPQPGGLFHYAAILRSSQEDPMLDILFKDFPEHSESLVSTSSHFVQLCTTDLSAFDKVHSHLQTQVAEYLEHEDVQKDPESNKYNVRNRKTYADAFLARIQGQPMTTYELRRCIAELQRFLLEVKAAMDWDLIFRRRIQGLDPPAAKVDEHRMGLFTQNPTGLAHCIKAGIPVFYILSIRDLPHTRIDTLVSPRKARDVLVFDAGRIKYPTISKSKPTDYRRFEEIYCNSRHVLHNANIFACNYNPPPPRSDAPRGLNSAGRNADSHKGIQVSFHPYRSNHITPSQRSNLSASSLVVKPVTSLSFPSVLPSWLVAIDSITAEQFPKDLPTDRGYAFPNPSLFFDSAQQTVKAPMVHRWLQVRDIMLFRVGPAVPANLTGPVSSRIWRRALQLQSSTFDSIRKDHSGSRSATEKREGLAFLESSAQAAGCQADMLVEQDATWRGNSYATPASLDDVVIKEVIFEISELNFRHELLALDRRLCSLPDPNSLDRHEQILDCIVPTPLPRAFLVVVPSQSSRGLAHPDIRQRVPCLNHLRNLMRSWRAPFTAFDSLDVNSDSTHLLAMEAALLGFYVHQFFIIFGRFPVVPRSL